MRPLALFLLTMLQSERLVIVPRTTQPTASISGTVTSAETGEAIAGATVTVTRHFGSVLDMLDADGALPKIAPVKTNERGQFSFQAIEGAAYDVIVQSKGYMNGLTGVSPNAGQRVDNVVLKMIRSASLNGTIRNKAGQSLAGVPIQLFQSDGKNMQPKAETRTGVDGSYNLEGFLPGDYVLAAGSPTALNGEPAASFARRVSVPNTNGLSVDATLDSNRYSMRGQVRVAIVPPPPDISPRWNVQVSAASRRLAPLPNLAVQYDTNGDFQVSNVTPGIYRIAGSLQAAGGCGYVDVVVSQSDVEGLEITLKTCL
jgi:hypothetical protein